MEDKRIAVMQPYFLPYIGYFQLLNAVDTFVIYDDVNFIKGGYINRNYILAQGKKERFNILLKGASSNVLIQNIELLQNNKWKKVFLKKIQQNYKKAKCFDLIYPILERIITFETISLNDFITNSFIEISKYLNINTKLIISSKKYKNKDLNRFERLVDICHKEKATHYINTIGGQDLYSKEEFKKNKIDLSFIKTKAIKYKQFENEFVPGLSILDVMMFNDKDEIKELLTNYELL